MTFINLIFFINERIMMVFRKDSPYEALKKKEAKSAVSEDQFHILLFWLCRRVKKYKWSKIVGQESPNPMHPPCNYFVLYFLDPQKPLLQELWGPQKRPYVHQGCTGTIVTPPKCKIYILLKKMPRNKKSHFSKSHFLCT